MASVPLEDLYALEELTEQTRSAIRGGGSNTNDETTAPSASSSIQYDPDSDFSIPLQVLQHALHHSMLVSVETVQGYVYQGTLVALDPYCNLTLSDVSVFRRRIPHVDFTQGSVLRANGTPMGFQPSVMLRGPQIILAELPSADGQLKNAYTQMARSVRRHIQRRRTMKTTGGATATSLLGKANDKTINGETHHAPAKSNPNKPLGKVIPKKKKNAKKILFKKDNHRN